MLVQALNTVLDIAIVIVMPLWFILFVAVTIYEGRRMYLLVQYKRGNVPREALPPLREELPDVSMRTILTDRLKR